MKPIAYVALLLSLVLSTAHAGSIFLTCHDPDYHATEVCCGPTLGPQHIIQRAVAYVTDAAHNPFAATAPRKFLFVESSTAAGKPGMVASGYVEGVDFEHHDAATLAKELALLGSKYAALVVASDFGGSLSQAELTIINANASAIATFLGAGGGVFAMSETNYTGLTPAGGHWAFVPLPVSTALFNSWESGFKVTAFGASLGLTDADVSSKYCHCEFSPVQGLAAVDVSPDGRVISLAGRGGTTAVQGLSWGRLKGIYR